MCSFPCMPVSAVDTQQSAKVEIVCDELLHSVPRPHLMDCKN